jgi:hypothetical protein
LGLFFKIPSVLKAIIPRISTVIMLMLICFILYYYNNEVNYLQKIKKYLKVQKFYILSSCKNELIWLRWLLTNCKYSLYYFQEYLNCRIKINLILYTLVYSPLLWNVVKIYNNNSFWEVVFILSIKVVLLCIGLLYVAFEKVRICECRSKKSFFFGFHAPYFYLFF